MAKESLDNLVASVVSKDDLESFNQQYSASRFMRAYLVLALSKELERKTKKSEEEEAYDCPNWSHKQADSNAERRTLRRFIRVLGGEELLKELES